VLCAFTYIIMQFQVPQFIDFEDKIFGPLSFKQFVYIAGGGGVIVVAYLYLPGFLFLLVALPIGTLAAALAFWQVNSRPFIITLEAAVKFFIQPKLFVWKKTADEDMVLYSAQAFCLEKNRRRRYAGTCYHHLGNTGGTKKQLEVLKLGVGDRERRSG